MADRSLRTRLFTASWPSFNGDLVDGSSLTEDVFPQQMTAPYCQVTVWAVPRGSAHDTTTHDTSYNSGVDVTQEQVKLPFVMDENTAADANGDGGDAEGVRGDGLIFVEPSLPMRSYNSISLSNNGRYRLTLSECHGYMPGTTATGRLDDGHFQGKAYAEASHLLFLPIPQFILFDVDDKISTGRIVIGNFQLLPIAHANQAWSPTLASPISPTVETLHALHHHQSVIPHHSVAERHDMLQPNAGMHVDSPRGIAVAFGGGLIVGVFVGLLVCRLFTWVRPSWWRRCGVWEKHVKRRQEDHGTKKVLIEDSPKDDREPQNSSPPRLDNKDVTDDDSYDSDSSILDGDVPDPVGLPRNEDDWRALFDKLYEDGRSIPTEAPAPADPGSVSPVTAAASPKNDDH